MVEATTSKNISKFLSKARTNKADEFYTQTVDIKKEVEAYPADIWKGKAVYLPCDDPAWSNFWLYFKDEFNRLGLANLFSTYLSKDKTSVITRYDGKKLLKAPNGSGDFRDNVEIMEQCDIIVTNPPFSLFRQFLQQVISIKKQFIILGNINAITNKEIFTLMMKNKLWFGPSIKTGDREFRVPDDYPLTAVGTRVDLNGTKYVRIKGVRWFTNIDYPNRYQQLVLEDKDLSTLEFFDNYTAVNCSKTKDIPKNYDGIIGVPITFMDKYNPEQFEILGMDNMMKDNPRRNKRFLFKGKETYGRIMIKHKSKPVQNR